VGLLLRKLGLSAETVTSAKFLPKNQVMDIATPVPTGKPRTHSGLWSQGKNTKALRGLKGRRRHSVLVLSPAGLQSLRLVMLGLASLPGSTGALLGSRPSG
jgi:hypothetical protein